MAETCNVVGCGNKLAVHSYHRKGNSYYSMCTTHVREAKKEIADVEDSYKP